MLEARAVPACWGMLFGAGDMGSMSILVITFTGIQGNRGAGSNSLPASLNRARNLAAKTLPDHMPKDIDLCLVLGSVVTVWHCQNAMQASKYRHLR